MLGAPSGAEMGFGKSGVDSLYVVPIFPAKAGAGLGNSACAVSEV